MPMGMSYSIVPNKPTTCANNFASGLSFFFEQVGGYEETAEVEQVSKILKINLVIFQDVDYNYQDKKDVEKHWHPISTTSSVVDEFIQKLVAHPGYYKQVHHNPDRAKQLAAEQKLWDITDTAERSKQLEQLRKQPFYYYPPDYGYLSQGRLLRDLYALKKVLDCFKKSGVTKIRFEYN